MLFGLYHCVDDHSYAEEDEWYAEKLSLVEPPFGTHLNFPRHLDIFHIFYYESGSESHEEENSCHKPRAYFSDYLPIHPHQENEKEQMASCLINLCRAA